MNYAEICLKAKIIAIEAGDYIRKNIEKKDIEEKGFHDYVTSVDKSVERLIIEKLQRALPEAGFIAEEKTNETLDKKYNWIIDPIDGTTNFIHKLYPFTVCIALKEYNEIVVGVVYEVGLKECFYAWKGSKSYLNGNEISVSKNNDIHKSLIAIGLPYRFFDRFDQLLNSLKYFMKNSSGVRRFGSAAVDLVYVACGRFDAFYEYGLSSWDVAAGAFIVQQAGGKLCDFHGGNNYIFGKEIIATNNNIHNNIFLIVRDFMTK